MAGFLYQIIQDNEKALYWFTKAAEQGDADAKKALDEIAKESKNPKKAKKSKQ
jgi:TPR repeat protein